MFKSLINMWQMSQKVNVIRDAPHLLWASASSVTGPFWRCAAGPEEKENNCTSNIFLFSCLRNCKMHLIDLIYLDTLWQTWLVQYFSTSFVSGHRFCIGQLVYVIWHVLYSSLYSIIWKWKIWLWSVQIMLQLNLYLIQYRSCF